MKNLKNFVAQVERLRYCSNPLDELERKRLLRTRLRFTPRSAPLLIRYHECLLFHAAYPESKAVLSLCEKRLRDIARCVRRHCLDQLGPFAQALLDSGIAGSHALNAFSIEAFRWLASQPDITISIDLKGKRRERVEALIMGLLGCCGDVMLHKSHSGDSQLSLLGLKSSAQKLHWLTVALTKTRTNPTLSDLMFDCLDLWVTWSSPATSRTLLRFPVRPLFLQRSSGRKYVPTLEILRQKLPTARTLSIKQKRELRDKSMGALLSRGREIDPVSYADPQDIHLFRLDRGIDVALFGLASERRLPIESYVGFVAAKNRLPIAYGGAWILGPRAEIGVNIFDTFRGAESAYLFSQVMRVYHQFLGAQKFLVQPYQFGHDNEEAISSGAFWFYYKLGFRPSDPKLFDLAEAERERRELDSNYRSPNTTLKKLTGDPLFINLSEVEICDYEVSKIAASVLQFVRKQFAGNLERAERVCGQRALSWLSKSARQKLSAPQLRSVRRLAVVLCAIPGISRWTSKERAYAAWISALKFGASESSFIRKIRSHQALLRGLAELETQEQL